MRKRCHTVGELALPYRFTIPVVGGDPLDVCIDWTPDSKFYAGYKPFTYTVDSFNLNGYVDANCTIGKLVKLFS
jgi:hypothetical protein